MWPSVRQRRAAARCFVLAAMVAFGLLSATLSGLAHTSCLVQVPAPVTLVDDQYHHVPLVPTAHASTPNRDRT